MVNNTNLLERAKNKLYREEDIRTEVRKQIKLGLPTYKKFSGVAPEILVEQQEIKRRKLAAAEAKKDNKENKKKGKAKAKKATK